MHLLINCLFFNVRCDNLILLTYIPPPRKAAPTKAMYIKFSPPCPAGPVDMGAVGAHVGILALVNPEINFRKKDL